MGGAGPSSLLVTLGFPGPSSILLRVSSLAYPGVERAYYGQFREFQAWDERCAGNGVVVVSL